ncbi:MAG TPA: BrnA antitoxin family protein [Acidisphaera sp.]|nr:BrnA antitoxin family protein [Acidisphaera sp.]
MQKKKQTGPAAWTDPDGAPLITKEMLDEAEVFDGNTFVRRGRGRPRSENAKEQISVRIDRAVLAKLRKAGPGWQSQINEILKRALADDDERKRTTPAPDKPLVTAPVRSV